MKSTFITILKYVTPFAILGAGFYWQLCSNDAQSIAFSRSGCLIVLYGIILESFYVIRTTNEGATIHKQLTIMGENDLIEPLKLRDYFKILPTHYGLIWVCIGTVIWGYGDMIK